MARETPMTRESDDKRGFYDKSESDDKKQIDDKRESCDKTYALKKNMFLAIGGEVRFKSPSFLRGI